MRHNPYMHHVPRVGAYLPRVGSYLPRVGAAVELANLPQNIGAMHAWQQGYLEAQTAVAKQAALATSEISTERRRQALFLPAALDNVPAGAFTVTVIPACDFQAEEFTIGANAGDVEINQITLGMKPLFAGSGPIPGSQFAPNSLASRACVGLVRAGTPLVITANALVATTFRGSFSGSALVES